MKNVLGFDKIYAEDDVWELMDESEEFNAFVGKCITHFAHFVVPRRDQTVEICQDYMIPESIDCTIECCIMLTRELNNNVRIEFWTW